MAKFLVDANLPYYFSLWNSPDYIHQKDIDDEWEDGQIWNYAKEHNPTIISKDSDFSNRILVKEPPPKVIHIRLGNMKLTPFCSAISAMWDKVLDLNETHKLVNVFIDRIEGVD